MRLERYLILEKILRINKDVDLIYNKCFKSFIDAFKKKKLGSFTQLIDDVWLDKDHIFGRMHSGDLVSKEVKEVNLVNPVEIKCGAFKRGHSGYDPVGSTIQISIHTDVLKIILRGDAERVDPALRKQFKSELTETKIKGTIAHELSHWIRDTKGNFFLRALIKIARELDTEDVMKLKKLNVGMTHFELDAQIHSIIQTKRKHKKEWDTLTLRDLFDLNPPVGNINRILTKSHGFDVAKIWQKALIKRMAREKLLGKNMRKFAKPLRTL